MELRQENLNCSKTTLLIEVFVSLKATVAEDTCETPKLQSHNSPTFLALRFTLKVLLLRKFLTNCFIHNAKKRRKLLCYKQKRAQLKKWLGFLICNVFNEK